MRHFPGVSLAWEPDNDSECQTLLRKIRPDWENEKLVCKSLVGGLLNTVLAYHPESSALDQDEALVLKIYRNFSPDGVESSTENSREREIIGLQVGYAAGCAPRPLAVFDNGFVCTYARGRLLTLDDLKNPSIVRSIARSVADLQSVDIQGLNLTDNKGEKATMKKGIQYVPSLKGSIDGVETQDKNANPEVFGRLDAIREELDFIEDYMGELNLTWGFCHHDLHVGNIIYDDEAGRVTFVDWECSRFTYTMCDTIWCLVHSPYFVCIGDEGTTDRLKEIDFESAPSLWNEWNHAYLERRQEIRQNRRGQNPLSSSSRKSDLSYRDLEGMKVPQNSTSDLESISYRDLEGRRDIEVEAKDLTCQTQIEREDKTFQILRILHHFVWTCMSMHMLNSSVLTSADIDLTQHTHLAWRTYQILKPELEHLQREHKCLSRRLGLQGNMFSHHLKS